MILNGVNISTLDLSAEEKEARGITNDAQLILKRTAEEREEWVQYYMTLSLSKLRSHQRVVQAQQRIALARGMEELALAMQKLNWDLCEALYRR
jgi:hypothetical protein